MGLLLLLYCKVQRPTVMHNGKAGLILVISHSLGLTVLLGIK